MYFHLRPPFVFFSSALPATTFPAIHHVIGQAVRARAFYRTEPLELWHGILCLFLGLWIHWVGYAHNDYYLYAPLLNYISPHAFGALFSLFALGHFRSIWKQLVWLRSVTVLCASLGWAFMAYYYFLSELHPMGVPFCAWLSVMLAHTYVKIH
jgi:hypothetical protein